MAVLEAQVAADTVERLFDGGQNAGEGRTVLILLVLPVVIIETQADRSVVAGTSWPGSLDGVAAFRVTLQIESLGKANVNIFRTTGGVSRVAPVDHGHRPVKVSVVGRPAEFDAALRRAKNNWIVCRCTRGSEVGLAVNVIRRQINRFRLREGQIQLELSEPHVQRFLRQSDPMAPLAFAASTEMSSSIQKERFWPKLPALMIVKVLGANKSVRGVNPVWVMKPAGCLRFNVKLPSYRKAMGRKPGISPGYTAPGKASFWAFEPRRTGGSLTKVSSSLGNLKPFFLNASPKSFNSG